ncbi:unnamed protein product, partial [Polarella glacialis]
VSRNASHSSLNRSASRPPYQRRLESNIDLVDPDDAGEMIISLPIEPMVQFRGTVIEESEVIPSKCAPLMLTCRMQPLSLGMVGGSERGLGGGFQATGPGPVVLGAPETREKYLLKVGDDLRQDQLMLELMALMNCVWREHLPAEDMRLLQLPEFRVLAVTPRAGYVKFVADSVPLSEALHQSRGNLAAWLKQNKPDDVSFDE